MHFLILAGGTAGDINPLIGLSKELLKKGHKVTFCTNDYFEEAVNTSGAIFISTGPKEVYLDLFNKPNTWKHVELYTIWEHIVFPNAVKYIRKLESLVTDDTVLINTMSTTQFRVARDFWKRPLVTVAFSPYQFYDILIDNSINSEAGLKEAIIVNERLCGQLKSIYSELKLKSEIKNVNEWRFSPDINVGLWPEWFELPNVKINSKIYLTDFIEEDGAYQSLATYDKLEEFLAENPIIVTGGSFVRHTTFFAPLIHLCKEAKRKLIIVSKEHTDVPEHLPDNVRFIPQVSFRELFMHGSLIVHIGGIGTISRALKAGKPQLIIPFFGDQYANADTVEALGCGVRVNHLDELDEVINRLSQDVNILKKAELFKGMVTKEPSSIAELILEKINLI